MKTRTKFAASVAVLLAVAVVWFWNQKGEETPVVPTARASEPQKRPIPSEAVLDAVPERDAVPLTSTTTRKRGSRILVGLVTDARGEPVSGARVRLEGEGQKLSSDSDTMGRYALAPLPDFTERIEVSALGYKTKIEERPAIPKDERARWDFTLEKSLGIFGTVTLADGSPAARAGIVLVQGKTPKGHAKANSDGQYTIDYEGELTDLYVYARHAQHGEGEAKVEARETNIVLAGGGYVEGSVRDPSGRPVASFSVALGSESPSAPGARSFDDPSGQFQLGPVAPGHAAIFVSAQGYSPGRAQAIVRSGQVTRGVVVTLVPSVVLTGFVRDARTRRPIAGALVAPAEWATQELAAISGATTGENGEYRLETVPRGRTTLEVSAPGYRTLLAGGVDGKGSGEARQDFDLVPSENGKSGSQLTGIGVTISKVDSGIMINGVIEGGPATGRLREGDVIVMVGDIDARTRPLPEVVQAIRGEAGSNVDLWVRRPGSPEPEHLVLTRDLVTVPERRGHD